MVWKSQGWKSAKTSNWTWQISVYNRIKRPNKNSKSKSPCRRYCDYAWKDGNTQASHTGIVTKVYPNGTFDTIEGNVTSDGDDRVVTMHYSPYHKDISGFVQLPWLYCCVNHP